VEKVQYGESDQPLCRASNGDGEHARRRGRVQRTGGPGPGQQANHERAGARGLLVIPVSAGRLICETNTMRPAKARYPAAECGQGSSLLLILLEATSQGHNFIWRLIATQRHDKGYEVARFFDRNNQVVRNFA